MYAFLSLFYFMISSLDLPRAARERDEGGLFRFRRERASSVHREAHHHVVHHVAHHVSQTEPLSEGVYISVSRVIYSVPIP